VVTHIFQKPLDNGYHRICVISINTLGLLDSWTLGLLVRTIDQCLIVGALYPSKSGLMNKHIVKHIGNRETYHIVLRRC
jgi:hypothetical protein